MSLPPGFLDEIRTRLSLTQVVGRKVSWDLRKSNQAKGDMWAPCPFHQEKTASFHVDDQKGFYYCFGCQAKGDMISFVRETENVDFIEAVRILASEAGLSMPERDPQAQQKADRRSQLTEVMEQALRFYRMQLRAGAGAEALAYISGRGLDTAALDRWEIGYAPGGWQSLWDHLRAAGVAEDLIFDAGLAKPSQKGGRPYDVFRDRVIFAIRDGRGRLTGFGGRAMDPDDPAKYLNSPETALFDKGRSLYNHGPAREAAGKGQALIVAEGYMDVIALSQAGFTGAVAPLGTAVTEHQLHMLWRITDEPVVALDGDAAGLRAAYRVVDLALPLLVAGKSLRFALMPQGQDPDDLLRAQGPDAVAQVLEGALPLVDLLWRREIEGRVLDSPDRRAALDRDLRTKLGMIQDGALRSHYGQAIKELRWQLFSHSRRRAPAATPVVAQPSTRASALAQGGASEDHLREAVILALALRNPRVIADFLAPLEEMRCDDPLHARLRDALLRAPDPSEETLRAEIGAEALEPLLRHPHVAVVPAVRHPDPVKARQSLAGELARLAAHRGHAQELREALEDLSHGADEHTISRLRQSARAIEEAGRGGEDSTEYDVGPNGAHVSRDEKSALERLLRDIGFADGPDKPS